MKKLQLPSKSRAHQHCHQPVTTLGVPSTIAIALGGLSAYILPTPQELFLVGIVTVILVTTPSAILQLHHQHHHQTQHTILSVCKGDKRDARSTIDMRRGNK